MLGCTLNIIDQIRFNLEVITGCIQGTYSGLSDQACLIFTEMGTLVITHYTSGMHRDRSLYNSGLTPANQA